MRKRWPDRLFLLLVVSLSLNSFTTRDSAAESYKGIEFFKGSFGEALLKAKQENKYLFVDVYATWCGPCKQLKKSFRDAAVGDYYNKNFINISVDGETAAGRELRHRYKIDGYPTLLILDSDGKVRTRTTGFLKPYILINFGRRIVP